MKIKRIISVVIILTMVLGVLAGCGKGKTDEETTTTAPAETTTAVLAEIEIATVGADGTITLIENPDGTAVVINTEDGNVYTIPAGSNAEAVKNEQGVITAVKLDDGTEIPVTLSADGTKLIIKGTLVTAAIGETTTAIGETTTSNGATTTRAPKSDPMQNEDVKAILANTETTATEKAEAIVALETLTDEEKMQVIEQIPGLSEEQKAKEIQELSVLSYKYSSDGYFYTDDTSAWQRSFGFNTLYDWAAPYVVMYYDTVRVKFRHNNKDWMIQTWKGQYGYLFVGSEIGLYTKDINQSADHYNCASDDECLDMSMTLYRIDELTGEYTMLFSRDFDKHWWITGFSPGVLNSFSSPRDELIMLGSIQFPDAEMAQKFVSGLQSAGFSSGSPKMNSVEKYTINGTTVTFSWRYIDQKLSRISAEEAAETATTSNKEITITFDAAGGNLSDNSKTYKVGSSFGVLPTPTKDGYKFVRWYEKGFLKKTTISESTSVGSSSHTVYAEWEKLTQAERNSTTVAPIDPTTGTTSAEDKTTTKKSESKTTTEKNEVTSTTEASKETTTEKSAED